MEILTQPLGDGLEVKVRGRLDNYWAEHLQRNLEEVIRGGAHLLWLNLAGVSYLSSAGVGLLVKFHNQLKAIGGSLLITNPSQHVKMVVDLCHLSPILLSPKNVSTVVPEPEAQSRRFSSAGASFELLECAEAKPLTCELIGDPDLLRGCRFGSQHCRLVQFPQSSFGLGLGAFGDGFEDVKGRFGEFLAVSGSAAYLPTDGTNVPDFVVSRGELVPELNVLYGLKCDGGFTQLLRFESSNTASPISLAELVRVALENSGAQTIGMVILAESAGLVGSALRRSPVAAHAVANAPFEYPEVRGWLSFSAERLYARCSVLIAGLALGSECKPLAPFLRRLATASSPLGHFHAVPFSYRPLQKGKIDRIATITALFETQNLQGVLHLLTDCREAAGPKHSEFIRGACWIGAVTEIH